MHGPLGEVRCSVCEHVFEEEGLDESRQSRPNPTPPAELRPPAADLAPMPRGPMMPWRGRRAAPKSVSGHASHQRPAPSDYVRRCDRPAVRRVVSDAAPSPIGHEPVRSDRQLTTCHGDGQTRSQLYQPSQGGPLSNGRTKVIEVTGSHSWGRYVTTIQCRRCQKVFIFEEPAVPEECPVCSRFDARARPTVCSETVGEGR